MIGSENDGNYSIICNFIFETINILIILLFDFNSIIIQQLIQFKNL